MHTVTNLLSESSVFPSKKATLTQQVHYGMYAPTPNKTQLKLSETKIYEERFYLRVRAIL